MSNEVLFDEYSDLESESVEVRSGKPRFVQVHKIIFGNINIVSFNFTNRDFYKSIGLLLTLRFNGETSSVNYQFDCSNSSGHTIRQINVGFFTTDYTTIDRPRSIPFNKSCPYEIKLEGNQYIIRIFGWRVYGVYTSIKLKSLDITLSVPLETQVVASGETMFSNYFKFSDFIKDFSCSPSTTAPFQRILNYYDSNLKTGFPLAARNEISVSNNFTERDLEIGRGKDPAVSILPEIGDGEHVADLGNVLRLYEVFDIHVGDFKTVKTSATLNPFTIKEIESNYQFWYGDNDCMLEGVVEYRHATSFLTFRLMYRFNGKAAFYKEAEFSPKLPKNNLGAYVIDLALTRHVNDTYDITLNGEHVIRVKLPVRHNYFQYGYEFQIYTSLMKGRKVSDIKRWKDYGTVVECVVDGKSVPKTHFIMKETDLKRDITLMSTDEAIAVSDVKKFSDIFRSRKESIIPVESDTGTSGSDNNLVKPEVVADVNKPFKLSKNLVQIVSSRLGNTNEESIFLKTMKHYEAQGMNSDDAELLIYQMAVSFCTSKNATMDSGNHLVFKDKRGELRKFHKHIHVRFMNSLSETPCNVERLVMRSRSDRILSLLRERVLAWPYAQAIRRGIKPEFAYLACDFFDLKSSILSEQELLALNSAQTYVQLRNKHKRTIVNVNQLR